MRKTRTNSKEQIQFARDLQEVNGVNLLDGRLIASSISAHHTAQRKRMEHKRELNKAMEEYFKNCGKVTYLEPQTT